MAFVMLSSALAGCAGSDSDSAKDERIASLESELANVTAQADESAAHAAALEVTLSEALATLDESIADLSELSVRLDSAEWHRANLTNQLSETMEQLNQTQDSGLLVQLEGEISNLTSQMEAADSQIADLSSEIAQKEGEINQLDATVTALESTMSSLTYEIRNRIDSCPEDNPGLEISVGYDDGAGAAIAEDGKVNYDEVQFTVGECPGDSGVVSQLQDGDARDWGPALFVEMGGNVYFAGNDGVHGWELWRSDGTVGGTYMVKDLREEQCGPDGMGGQTCENGGSLAVHCWGSPFGCHYPEIVAGNNKIFFTGFDGEPGTESCACLVVSDGTSDGTYQIPQWSNWGAAYGGENGWREGFSGASQLLALPSNGFNPDRVIYSNLEAIGGQDDDSHPPSGEELWISDGTETGTFMLANIVPEDESWQYEGVTYCCGDFQGSAPRDIILKGSNLWFTAESNEYGREVYRYSLSGLGGGLFLVKDIRTGIEGSNPLHLTSASGGAFLSADDGLLGQELYFSQGDAFSTRLVKDIWPGDGNSSSPNMLTKLGQSMIFSADDGQHGRELWVSDNTESGTFMVKDINANGSSDPSWFTVMDDTLYFMAYTEEHGTELWRSDGTTTGTYIVKDINPGNESSFFWTPDFFHQELLLVHNGELYFIADDGGEFGAELWRTNGMELGTEVVVDINPGNNSSWPNRFISVGEKLYFTAWSVERGRQLMFFWDNPGPEITPAESS
ncbi:MAG: ELWxxDGT repeat protein [Candidatus Thermoplasmatota archaeon]|nr:ELWxxDGT repeat protein [Candidatus Thermoplasmatota archaeon]